MRSIDFVWHSTRPMFALCVRDAAALVFLFYFDGSTECVSLCVRERLADLERKAN